jgi:hypothetical protein
MIFAFTGKAMQVFERIREMKEMAERGGGIIYRGYRMNGAAYVRHDVITGEGRYTCEYLDPAPSQALFNHSPDGFEWGYSGSGPAQLALALILDPTGDKVMALKYHQDFKEHFVACWGQSWHINSEQIKRWIALKQFHDEQEGN